MGYEMTRCELFNENYILSEIWHIILSVAWNIILSEVQHIILSEAWHIILSEARHIILSEAWHIMPYLYHTVSA